MLHRNKNSLKTPGVTLYFTPCCNATNQLRRSETQLKGNTMITVDQIASSQKANLETFYGLTHSAFAGFEKKVELNLTATKAALSETMGHAHAAMGVKDAQELMALQAGLIQPLAEKSVSYSRHLYDIATSTGAQFGKAMEDKSVEAAKNAPAGSETAVSMVKSAVAASQNAMESMQKAVKQATDMAEANFNAVTASAVTAAKTASKKR
jgi:phasin family protein